MSDHWDGPGAKGDPAADITDFYIFPIEEDGRRRLVLIMNVHPAADATSRFDDAVNYNFRIRGIDRIGWDDGRYGMTTGSDELRISCRSDSTGPAVRMAANVWRIPGGTVLPNEPSWSTEVTVEDTDGGPDPMIRLYAGLRADTSFTDLARVRLPVWRDISHAAMPGVNSLAGHNVLGIVLVIDQSMLPQTGTGSLDAATTETIRHYVEHGEPARHRIDRLGWPEVNVWMIQDDDLRDQWNSEDPFHLDPAHVDVYRGELQGGLSRLDNFEKSLTGEDVIDWPVPHPMIDMLLTDCLIVDVARPTEPSSSTQGCLEIMQAYAREVPHSTCGGRVPNEDVIGPTLTWYINGPDRPEPLRGSGVSAPEKPVTDHFPYLRPPTETGADPIRTPQTAELRAW